MPRFGSIDGVFRHQEVGSGVRERVKPSLYLFMWIIKILRYVFKWEPCSIFHLAFSANRIHPSQKWVKIKSFMYSINSDPAVPYSDTFSAFWIKHKSPAGRTRTSTNLIPNLLSSTFSRSPTPKPLCVQVAIFSLSFVFLASPCGLRDLNFPTSPCSGSAES